MPSKACDLSSRSSRKSQNETDVRRCGGRCHGAGSAGWKSEAQDQHMLHGVDDESEMERETQLLGRQTSLLIVPPTAEEMQ